MVRCFIAIDVSDDVRARIRAAQQALQTAVPGDGVRWTRPDAWHVTLAFLAAIPPTTIAPLRTALHARVEGHAPFQLTARGLGGFPTLRRPRVVWVGIDGARDALGVLHGDIRVALSSATGDPADASVPPKPTGPRDDPPFAPHLTLARVRRPDRGALERASAALAVHDFGSWTVDHVTLYRSHLGAGGSRYETLAVVPLAGAEASLP